MTFADEQLAIESRFAANFTACSIKYQNVDFNPDEHDLYVDLQIKNGPAFLASIGPSPLHRSIGVISVNVFTRHNIGTKTGRVIADKAAAIFRLQSFSGITCEAANVTNMGEREGRYLVNMTVAFFRDEIF